MSQRFRESIRGQGELVALRVRSVARGSGRISIVRRQHQSDPLVFFIVCLVRVILILTQRLSLSPLSTLRKKHRIGEEKLSRPHLRQPSDPRGLLTKTCLAMVFQRNGYSAPPLRRTEQGSQADVQRAEPRYFGLSLHYHAEYQRDCK